MTENMLIFLENILIELIRDIEYMNTILFLNRTTTFIDVVEALAMI